MLAGLYVSSLSHDVSRRFSAPKTCVVLCAPHTGAGGGMLLELAGACECANQRRMLSSSNIFATTTTTFKTQNKHMVTEVDSSWFFGFLDLQSQFLPTSDMVSSPSPHQTQVWVVRVKALQLPFWRCIVFWCDMINRVRPRDEGINLVGWFKNMKKPRQTEWFCFATLNSFPLLHHVAHHVAMFGLSPPWVHQCHQCAPTWVCHPAGSQCQCAKSRITVSFDRRIHPPKLPTNAILHSIHSEKEGPQRWRIQLLQVEASMEPGDVLWYPLAVMFPYLSCL